MTMALTSGRQSLFERIERVQYLFTLSGSVSSRLATLAVLILLPSYIGLHNYGLFALVITLGEIIEMTAANWFRLLLIRQSVQNAPAAPAIPTTRFSFTTLAIGTTLLSVIAACVISPFMPDAPDFELSVAVSVYVVNFAILRLVLTLLQALNRQGLFGLVESIRGVAMLILVFGTVLGGWGNFFHTALAFSFAAGLSILISLPVLGGSFDQILSKHLAAGTFKAIAIPTILVTALTFQFGWVDRLILQTWLGPTMVGLYVAATAVARQPVDLVLFALNQHAFPALLSQDRGGEGDRKIAGYLVASCILGFGAAGACIVLARPIVECVLPSFDRALAAQLIGPIAIGAVALGIKHVVFDNIFHAYGRNWLLLAYLAGVSLATLALSITLVKFYGPAGAAISFMIGSCAAVLVSALVSRALWPFKIPMQSILRVLACAVIAAAIVTAALSLLPHNAWLQLIAGGIIYGGAYFALLVAIVRFDLRRFIAAPWEQHLFAGQQP
ncbi:MAG: hypothetical protein BGP04_13265 [Rhizobiales bacterium 62-17]|nr:polysaccharide biosynthesis C-terminal domain-containing protein [Hyphomicrobiales bacterium]OJY02269.1 MAG: hypothetical protein BGP04_13265 [Rhizobiales bacterium 62-17]